jgi:signal peptide peptidase SppA
MRIIDIINDAWAVTPEMFQEIQRIYVARMMGPKLDKEEIIAAIEAKTGQPFKPSTYGSRVQDGVAVLNVEGVLARRMNMMMYISGGTSMEQVQNDFMAAVNDPAVKGIILDIDSPGGTVSGTEELANAIFTARGSKPIIAYTGSTMASAAYWVGAAADAVYISGNTPQVGSIGVVGSHVDVSRREEQMGIKTTEISAGKYKRIASSYAPLTEEGRAVLQESVDSAYTAFVDAVAQFRGTTTDDVLNRMADGRVFRGRQAIDAGLVDGVSTLDDLINSMNQGRPITGVPSKSAISIMHAPAGAPTAANETEENMNTVAELKEKYPDLCLSLIAEGEAGMAAAVAAARQEGAAAELQRILAVEAQLIPGHEALIASFKADGKTTGPEAAAAIIAAEKAQRTAAVAAIDAAAGTVVVAAEAPVDASTAIDPNLPVEERAKAEWDKSPEIRGEFGSQASYLAFRKAEEEGRVRILKK